MDHPLSLPPLDIPGLLRRYHLRPEKSLGQNFLVDSAALQSVAQAAEISPDDLVLEIGPGLGSLTRLLAMLARRVVAVELDARLIEPLNQVLAPFPNLEIIHGDILKLEPGSLLAEPGYLVVANIPYYITSALLRHLLEASLPPKRLVLTLQSEVADRICAAAGEMSLLALSVQVYGAPRVVAHIPSGAFYPPPKVDSAVVRVDLYPFPLIPSVNLECFFQLAKAGFSQKRKTLRNSLAGGLGWKPAQAEALLVSNHINPQRRAETLSLEEWAAITQSFSKLTSPQKID